VTLLAAVAAVPALVRPTPWLAGCVAVALAFAALDAAGGQVQHSGSADVVVVPSRVVGRLALRAVNPVTWIKLALGALVSLAAGAVVAAIPAALRWVAARGTDGILAAMRMGAWANAPRYAVVAGCFVLLRGVRRTHDQRAEWLRQLTRRFPETVLCGVVVVVVVAAGAFVLTGPQHETGPFHSDHGLGWLPTGLRAPVDSLRDEVVRSELDAVTSCLHDHQGVSWIGSYTSSTEGGVADVARLTADPAAAPVPSALGAAVLAADNHLAPWVDVVEVAVGDRVVLRVGRHGTPHDRPLTDSTVLRARAEGAPPWLATAAPGVDRATVLACSAGTPL
jgi:hypothetical protein